MNNESTDNLGNLRQEINRDGTDAVLDRLDKDRKQGLELLERKVENLQDRDRLSDPESENLFREVTSALSGLLTATQAMDNYLNLLAHDTSMMAQMNDKGKHDLFQIGAHHQALIGALEHKGLVTNDDIKQAWEKIIPEAVKDVKEAITPQDDGND